MKSLLALIVLAALPAAAQDSTKSVISGARAETQKQQAVPQKPAEAPRNFDAKYNFARYEYNHGGNVGAILSAREYLFRSDNAQIGGPRHVASFIFEPCSQNPGVCLVLLEPIRDIMKASGDQTNPYVYAVASSVLYVAARKFGSLAALNAAYNQYTANNVDAATPAALDILRMMLASSRAVKADDPNDYHHDKIYTRDVTVAAMAAGMAEEFSDASRFLEKNMKDSLEDSKNQARTVALAQALTERARNVDTLARLGRAYQRTDPPPTDDTRIALMKDIGIVARTVWPRRLDAANHGVWDPAVVQAAVPYFSIACAVINDEKNGCSPRKAAAPLCDAGMELLGSVPRNHRATCNHPEGTPSEN
jgi:hypothetical protein